MRRARRFFLIALALVVGVTTLVVAAWALDTSRSDGKVARSVTVAGKDVSGLDRRSEERRVGKECRL